MPDVGQALLLQSILTLRVPVIAVIGLSRLGFRSMKHGTIGAVRMLKPYNKRADRRTLMIWNA